MPMSSVQRCCFGAPLPHAASSPVLVLLRICHSCFMVAGATKASVITPVLDGLLPLCVWIFLPFHKSYILTLGEIVHCLGVCVLCAGGRPDDIISIRNTAGSWVS